MPNSKKDLKSNEISGEIVLKVDRLRKKFSQKNGDKVVLDCHNLILEKGKLYTLCGQNGAGKSTLINIIMRQVSADKIDGLLFDKNITSDNKDIYQRIGYVSEKIEFNFNFSIDHLTELYASLYQNWSKETFKMLMKKLKLSADKKLSEYSRGQKMQVAFALAVSIRPQLLLVDEITAVLDPSARDYICQYIRMLVDEGCTVLMATNLVSEIQQYSDHLLLIDNGDFVVNCPMNKLDAQYLKLRLTNEQERKKCELFENENCSQVSVNSDRSTSYLLRKDSIPSQKLAVAGEFLDRRRVTAEEVFIYHSRKTSSNENQKDK